MKMRHPRFGFLASRYRCKGCMDRRGRVRRLSTVPDVFVEDTEGE